MGIKGLITTGSTITTKGLGEQNRRGVLWEARCLEEGYYGAMPGREEEVHGVWCSNL